MRFNIKAHKIILGDELERRLSWTQSFGLLYEMLLRMIVNAYL